MNNDNLHLMSVAFESRWARLILAFVFAITIFLSGAVHAHYPFPCTQQEKEKAAKIGQAEDRCDREGVEVLIGFLADENPRVRTAAFISLIHLSGSQLNMAAAVPAANKQKDSGDERASAYLSAAAQVFLVLQNPALSDSQKQDRMIELSAAEDGAIRRMAVEGLRAVGDQKCLSALARRINDPFGDHDDSYDMRAVARVAFEVWWEIKGANLDPQQQISTIIDSLTAARPFMSRWADAACDILEEMDYAAVPQLIEAYSGDSGNTKSWAARTLRKPELRGSDRARVRVVALGDLRSADPNDRRMATYLLGKYYDRQDLALYVELLRSDEDYMIRNFAVSRLGDLGGAEAIAALKEALDDEQGHTRVLAARTLAALGQDDGHELLFKSFDSLDSAVRNISLGAIEYLNQDQVCARMLELLEQIPQFDSPDERQRFLFVYAREDVLRYLDTMPVEKLKPAISTLKSLLKYPEDSISRRAAGLLKKLGVALEWKYDVGLRRGWFEVVPAGGNENAGKVSEATVQKSLASLSSADRRAAEAQLSAAWQLLSRYWAMKERSPDDSPEVSAALERAASAFQAVCDKYPGTNMHAQALAGLFQLYRLASEKKKAGAIVDLISERFGSEAVSDAYFELGLAYLQRAHDPARALEWFEKIPVPAIPDADDRSAAGLHNREQARHDYLKVQQPMAKCEVQLGHPEMAEKRYDKMIELFPELKDSLQRSLVFEVESIATRTPRNKYWLSLSALKQMYYQREAVRWLEDYRRRQAEQE